MEKRKLLISYKNYIVIHLESLYKNKNF